MLSDKRILLVAPHPDDVEMGCGATIARYHKFAEMWYLILSPCLEDPRNKDILVEATNAIGCLGLSASNMIAKNLLRRTFHEQRREIRDVLIAARDDVEPDVVFCPSLNDIHQDHSVTAEEALRLFRDRCIVAYENPRSAIYFQPNLYIKVSAENVRAKVEALMQYKSQFDRYYFNPDIIRSFLFMRGSQCANQFAEAFEVLRWVA